MDTTLEGAPSGAALPVALAVRVESDSNNDENMPLRQREGLPNVICCAARATVTSHPSSLPPLQMEDLLNLSEARRWINEAEWTIGIQRNFYFDRLRSPSSVSIFRVPNFLKESTERKVYVPKMVSLGPYHHTIPELSPMECHKERALHRMMIRFIAVGNDSDESNSEDFSLLANQEISRLEDEIRKVYEEKINYSSERLTLLLIQDGCFILEILRTLGGEKLPVPNTINYYEAIFEKNKIDFTGLDILNDMLKLENQIPLMVLRSLLKLELNSSDTDVETKLSEVLLKYASSKFYPFKCDRRELSLPQGDEHHLLKLLHSWIVGDSRPSLNDESENDVSLNDESENDVSLNDESENDVSLNDESENDVRRIPRAVELKNVGIKFKPCEGFIRSIDFDRKNATIGLPHIYISAHTEVLFRNLIALEVCMASEMNYVTCYVSLMDELIDTGEDVALLRDKRIVTNCLGSDEEAAQLFNGLLKGVTLSRKDAFKQLKQDVDDHYRSQFKVYFAELMKDHLSSPWKTIALGAAILVLLFTAVQTVFSIVK